MDDTGRGSDLLGTSEPVPPWNWNTPSGSGPRSSDSATPDSPELEPQVPARVGVVARAILATVPPLMTLAVSFGLPWSPEQQAAAVAAVTAVTGLVVAVLTVARRRD